MKQTAHEEFTEFSEIKLPSNRSFGLTVGLIGFAIGLFRWFAKDTIPLDAMLLIPLGAALAILAIVAPQLLAVPNLLWMKLGGLLARIMNPLIMALMYFGIFMPVALVFRMFGRDALHLRINRGQESYWISRDPPGPDPATMTNQF
jgi:hypothetical protein